MKRKGGWVRSETRTEKDCASGWTRLVDGSAESQMGDGSGYAANMQRYRVKLVGFVAECAIAGSRDALSLSNTNAQPHLLTPVYL